MILDGDFTPEEFEKARRMESEGENPNYGPGNPDWELDFDRDIDIGTCQSCGRYHNLRVRTCPCGGYVG